MLTSEQFDRTRRLALGLAGLELSARHRELLDRRIERVGLRGEAGLEALLGGAEAGDPGARRRLIGLLTTNFTGFFRHPWHFHLAAEHALWTVHRHGTARVWSTAAATGEEPYSLSIELIQVFRREDPPVEIVATDLDADALELARRGEYAESALAGVAPEVRSRFFEEGSGPRRSRIAATARRLVTFGETNLSAGEWLVQGPFDVVFCRNVLMYLEASRREAAVERIASMLSSGGLLLLDPAEHLGHAARLFDRGVDGVFARRRENP